MSRSKEQFKNTALEVKAALTEAAGAITDETVKHPISQLLPIQQFTRPIHNVSHYISEADLLRLRHCGKGSLSPYLELFWGAAFGGLAPFLASISKYASSNKTPLEISDHIAITLMAVFVAVASVLSLLKVKNKETIDMVCDEIMNRNKADI